ncbi:YARHG domain-containing protein [Fibrobacter intestinalis]|uniref:YARHG domain-containing protein n=1 Tax=Fibrobacter intestinalis TaxID=28122 RepID=UPI0009F87467
MIDENFFKKLFSRQFDESELSSYTKSELRMMRNSIFARYGYRFKSEKIYCASLEERI